VLRAELELVIRGNDGLWRPETFRVDSGTEMTSMAAMRATALDLPMPQNAILLDALAGNVMVRQPFSLPCRLPACV
jgi:hypothetical protein